MKIAVNCPFVDSDPLKVFLCNRLLSLSLFVGYFSNHNDCASLTETSLAQIHPMTVTKH